MNEEALAEAEQRTKLLSLLSKEPLPELDEILSQLAPLILSRESIRHAWQSEIVKRHQVIHDTATTNIKAGGHRKAGAGPRRTARQQSGDRD